MNHEATRTGAPVALLHLLRWMKKNTRVPFSIVLANGGDLTSNFEDLADTLCMERSTFHPGSLTARALRAARRGSWACRVQAAEIKEFAARHSPTLVYANSVVSARTIALLAPRVPVLTHVHELESAFRDLVNPEDWRSLLGATKQFIACSKAVRENLINRRGVLSERIETIHESISIDQAQPCRSKKDVLRELNLPANALLVMGGGNAGWRKGTDLFVQIARAVNLRRPSCPIYFVWVGGGSAPEFAQLEHDIRLSKLEGKVRLLGLVSKAADYFAAADVFVLPSREDPYPLVCLEAAAVAKPIVCFDSGGGIPEFVEHDCGFVVPYLDIARFAEEVLCLIDSESLRSRMGAAARVKVMERHDIGLTASRVLELMNRLIANGS